MKTLFRGSTVVNQLEQDCCKNQTENHISATGRKRAIITQNKTKNHNSSHLPIENNCVCLHMLKKPTTNYCLARFIKCGVLVLQKSHFQLFFMGLIIEVGVSEVVVKALQACKN